MAASRLRTRLLVGRVLTAVFFVCLAVGSVVASQLGYVERLRERLAGKSPRLAAGDFPAGVMAPVDDVVKVPTRPLVVGLVPRGSIAPILLAAGDADHVGLFRAAYAIDVKVQPFTREEDLRRALVRGGDNGGVDVAALAVSSLAMSASLLRDAAPRVVLLVGRSRGQEVVVARGKVDAFSQLARKRIGAEPRSASWYLLLWSLSRAGLSLRDIDFVPLDSAFQAGGALKGDKVDAVAGYAGELAPLTKELGGSVVATTADAPHLIATVLVSRGDFAARYPDGLRRLLRGILDANQAVLKDPVEATRLLGAAAPQLGDPAEAVSAAPPATLKDNLAFFSLGDEAPVTFHELFQSAAALNTKLFDAPAAPAPEDIVDLSALKYISSTSAR
jgi:ABC-type nitrate/sulfonate/bicarbonate transport system substrate-binding protein